MKNKFRNLKQFNFEEKDVTCSLAVVSEYKKDRTSKYNIKYVATDKKLENKLKNIVKTTIEKANSFEEYSFDCPEPEGDMTRTILSKDTDFKSIFDKLSALNPEEDKIENVNELVKSKSYMIIIRNLQGIQIVGYKSIPENWKLKKEKGLLNLLFKDNCFENLENENVFSISSTIDFFYYDSYLFILSKKAFEFALNFREGMINKADELYEELTDNKLFLNIDILKQKIGDNLRYLRKLASIKKLGYYKDPNFLKKFREVNEKRKWNIEINENNEIKITEEKIDDILSVLQNKRLFSELTEEGFDVESAKPIE